MKETQAILLAAGEGTRMHSKTPKVLHNILNHSMLSYVIEAARGVAKELCVVVGHQGERVMAALAEENLTFVHQSERLGTGHAVMQASDFIHPDGDVVILCGDTPLVTGETLQALVKQHREQKNSATVLSAILPDPSGYGRIMRDKDGVFLRNLEHKDANEQQRETKEINTGIYCFQGAALLSALSRLTNDNNQKEYYLPDTLTLIREAGGKVDAVQEGSTDEFLGVNSRIQLAEATEKMKQRINRRWMERGVTIVDPAQTYIDADASIGEDSVLLPGCVIEGRTVIGQDCIIGPHARLTDMILGDGVRFQASTGMRSTVGNETTVGPYAYIRPDCIIGDHVKIGDFVEVKNSKIGNHTKISHLTYIGDTDAGERINFGCGTVTVNYDGRKKYRTTIEDDVFVGCNANLVAPVTLEAGSYVAAGSTVTKNVPVDALAVARTRQQNILGWTKKH